MVETFLSVFRLDQWFRLIHDQSLEKRCVECPIFIKMLQCKMIQDVLSSYILYLIH